MTVALAVSGMTSAGAANFNLSSVPGSGVTNVEVQYCSRADFKYVPVWKFFLAAANGNTAVTGFNQAAGYYFRARAIFSIGVADAWSPVVGAYFPLGTAQVTAPPPIVVSPALIMPPETIMSWTASSEIAGYPARAMGRDDPGSMWLANMASNQCVFIMQISGRPIDTIAVLEANIPEGMTITVQADNTLAAVQGNSPAYSYGPVTLRPSANVPGRRAYHGLLRLPAPQAYQYWRVVLTGVVPGSVFGASYAMLGLALQTKNYANNSKTQIGADLGSLDRGRDGNANRALGYRMRNVSMDIALITETQLETKYSQLFKRVGTTEPVLAIPNTTPGAFLHDRILYGAIASWKDVAASALNFTESISIDSLI